MSSEPVRIVPRLVERIWGRIDLGDWVDGSAQTGCDPVGEAWLTDRSCEIEGGGTPGSAPVLAKLLFTAAPLSVQVHPTDAAARSSGVAAFGKNEAWHVLEAASDSTVWVGFKAPITPERLRAAAANGVVLPLLRSRLVHVGDTVQVRAGMVHAIGAGLVLLEVQDPVDITYRLDDHGRKRPLQVEEALAVADLGPPSVDAASGQGASLSPGRRMLASAPRFVAERCDLQDRLVLHPDGGRYHVLVALTAGACVNGQVLRQGQAIFVPARGRTVTLGGNPQAKIAVLHAGPGPTPCIEAPSFRLRASLT